MKPYLEDADFTLYNGDVNEVLAGLPDESVHCVVTSPPYWGLRDYGTGSWDGGDPNCDHVDPDWQARVKNSPKQQSSLGSYVRQELSMCRKCGARRTDNQLGLEPTPDAYVQNMVAVFRDVRRVLRKDGTCWLNIGDSYNADHKQRPRENMGLNTRNARTHENRLAPGLKPKDLVGIPWRLAFALQADGWYLRADIIWAKPNPMPESVTDRPTKAHEYVFLLTRSPRYFFDQEAVRESAQDRPQPDAAAKTISPNGDTPWLNNRYAAGASGYGHNPSGRNIRSVWEIATQPYAEAHFATFPEALVERCVKAGTSERGACPECGAPWERETSIDYTDTRPGGNGRRDGEGFRESGIRVMASGRRLEKNVATTSWRRSCKCVIRCQVIDGCTGCRHCHNYWASVPCVVLDPFMGSGTTALVARRLGRKAIGVELNPDYCALAARRLQQLSLLAI